jgi:hypothetical protein
MILIIMVKAMMLFRYSDQSSLKFFPSILFSSSSLVSFSSWS